MMKKRAGMAAKSRITAACAAVFISAAILVACTGALPGGTPPFDTADAEEIRADDPSPVLQEDDARRTPASSPEPDSPEATDTLRYIENLDKRSDSLIREAYELRPGGFTVTAVYDGTFSGSGNPEKLAVIKVADQPHVGGLDAHIAAVYDAKSLENISAQYFATDLFAYHVATGDDGRGYFIYVGFYANTGLFDYAFALYEMGDPWRKIDALSDGDDPERYHIILDEHGSVSVLENLLDPRSSRRMLMLAEPKYAMVFDPQTHAMRKTGIAEDEKYAVLYDVEYGYSLIIPASWRGLYDVETTGDGATMFRYAKAANPSSLFTIEVKPRTEVDGDALMLQSLTYDTGAYALVLTPGTDAPASGTQTDEIARLIADVPAIAASYRTGNGGLLSQPADPPLAPEP